MRLGSFSSAICAVCKLVYFLQSDKVTDMVTKIAESFKCKPIEGILSHELKQNILDGEKAIIQNPNEAQKKDYEKCTFEVHEVYAIDALISTGEGQVRR
jgi:methionine aminopeptidase